MGNNGSQTENAVTVRGESAAVMTGDMYSMNLEALSSRINAIEKLYKTIMKDGQDYGTIPGTGDRKTLLKPGSEKLMMLCQLAPVIKKDEIIELGNGHREYRMTVVMQHRHTGEIWGEGVGSATTMESKHRYRYLKIKCPTCGNDLMKSKDKDEYFCWVKKNGCGATFALNAPEIKDQAIGKGENQDIADVYNTVYKMCHKRAVVSAVIIATGVSNMFTQDVEDFEDMDDKNNHHDDNGHPENKGSGSKPAQAGNVSPVYDIQQSIETARSEKECSDIADKINQYLSERKITESQAKQMHKILAGKLDKITKNS